jgi:hypothetical protein
MAISPSFIVSRKGTAPMVVKVKGLMISVSGFLGLLSELEYLNKRK